MMTKEEALKLLDTAPMSLTKASRINPIFTQADVVDIVYKGIMTYPDGKILPEIIEKRVKQVVQDRKRP